MTPAGVRLLSHAERLLHLAEVAEQDLMDGSARGTLRLGSLESAAGARLPPILSTFHNLYPEVSIELQTGTTGMLLRRLASYEVEAAFVSEPFEAPGCSSHPAFEERLVLITAKGAKSPVRASELRGQTLVAFPHGCSYRRRLMEWLAADGASAGRILELGSYHAIVACVAAGAGIAIVPAEILDNAVMAQSIERHDLPTVLSVNRTHLVWSEHASPALQLLLSLLTHSEEAQQSAGAMA